MPEQNRFRHQAYGGTGSGSEWTTAPHLPPLESDEFRRRMVRVANTFEGAGVAGIYLLHGTFVGADASGALREVARVAPSLAATLQKLGKKAVDRVTKDAGNYTQQYAETLEHALAAAGGRKIPVKLLTWSGENHHIGRADGAVRLLDALAVQPQQQHNRWLLWGHSHGGNVLALVSNLLGSDVATNERFFRAARSYYRWPVVRRIDLPIWRRVAEQLSAQTRPWNPKSVDMITFGTPVRYGWDTGGVAGLLHFIHHKSADGSLQAKFPPTMDDVAHAAGGDLLQQIGIAGTNFPPTLWAWRACLADRRLSRILQAGLHKRDFLTRLRLGQRVHADGINLLINYGPIDGTVVQHLAGHAIYTRRRWLLFHTEEIATRLYGMPKAADNVD